MTKLVIEVANWRPFARGTLLGFATVYVRELRMEIRDVAIHQKGASRWAQLPAKPILKDGAPVLNRETGKPDYAKLLSFDTKAIADRFSAVVIEALDRYLVRERSA